MNRKINYIAVHCTATREGEYVSVSDIDRMHQARGWSGCGYHFVVYLDGSIHAGRPIEQIGAHVSGFNKNSIGVVYVGGLDRDGHPKDTRTPTQKAALKSLLETLHAQFPDASVLGHRDFSPDRNHNGVIERREWLKECPCFDVTREYPGLPHKLPK